MAEYKDPRDGVPVPVTSPPGERVGGPRPAHEPNQYDEVARRVSNLPGGRQPISPPTNPVIAPELPK